MTLEDVLQELEAFGNESTKKILRKHGARDPFFGVKVGDLKKILKKTKKNHDLSLALYETGNSDAMYLAALMADEKQTTKSQLEDWITKAYWYYLSEYAVAPLAAETDYGFELGLQWIQSKEEHIAAAGWATLAYIAGISADEKLDLQQYQMLLDTVEKDIHDSQNRVKYAMNGFVIAVGSYIESLTEKSRQIAEKIGKVSIQMGDTACKVPLAKAYIQKVVDKGRIGKKRKKARC